VNYERLVLGTAQFGLDYGVANQQGQVPFEEAKKILKTAETSGVKKLDTAALYGDAEKQLGLLGIKTWSVISKLPVIPCKCANIYQFILGEVHASLQKLDVKYLDGFLLHRPKQLLEPYGRELYRSLQQLKNIGLIRKIGISVYAPEELERLCEFFQFDIVQVPCNLIDRRFIDSGLIHRLAEKGIEVHVRSVFLQGLLLMQAHERPNKFSRWSSLWMRLDAWLKEVNLTPLEACLAFVFSSPQISNIIVGVESEAQLQQILYAANLGQIEVPDELACQDLTLLDPSRW
jgi:aryl-alcohol dehydrogenase-like predicted oxidoreductase